MAIDLDKAWNNFVFYSEPSAYTTGSVKWAAATAKQFIGLANNGGLNSFLTSTYEVDPREVVAALSLIGATVAAKQLGRVLCGLGHVLLPSAEEERWYILERYWTPDLNELDILSSEADAQLMAVLTEHVLREGEFYVSLLAQQPSGQST